MKVVLTDELLELFGQEWEEINRVCGVNTTFSGYVNGRLVQIEKGLVRK